MDSESRQRAVILLKILIVIRVDSVSTGNRGELKSESENNKEEKIQINWHSLAETSFEEIRDL